VNFSKIEQLNKKWNETLDRVCRDKKSWMAATDHALDCLEAQELIQSASQMIQQQASRQISEVVTRCLAVVFDEPYRFEIRMSPVRGKTSAKLIFARGEMELTEPIDEVGGGVVDVASFALRLTALIFDRAPGRRVIILDEPFKFVHPPERRPRIVSMLEMLSSEFGVQIIMVTGIDELMVGKVIEL